MIDYIYGVALNGALPVATYRVVDETKKLYVIDRYVGSTIRKDTMSDRWEHYYTNKADAEKFLASIQYGIVKATKHIDVSYVHKELIAVESAGVASDRLKQLIKYIEEFI